MKKLLLALFFVSIGFASTSSPVFAFDKTTITPTAHWEYEGYVVDQYFGVPGLQIVNYSEPWREHGILPLSDNAGNLWIFNNREQTLTSTPYQLAYRTAYPGYRNSSRNGLTARVLEVDKKILVMNDGSLFLFDPINGDVEQLLDKDATDLYVVENQVYWGGGATRVVNEQIYFTSVVDGEYKYFWLQDVNTVEEIYELPISDMLFDRNELAIGIPASEYLLKNAPHIALTDTLGAEHFVGQVNGGIYIANEAGDLTKIGYTDQDIVRAENEDHYYIDSKSQKSPRTVGDSSVAWIGEDRALYVATIDLDNLAPTGLQDIPTGMPFRSESDSAVYFRYTDGVFGVRKFISKNDYVAATGDESFEYVVTIPDQVLSSAKHNEWQFSFYQRFSNIWTYGNEPDYLLDGPYTPYNQNISYRPQ